MTITVPKENPRSRGGSHEQLARPIVTLLGHVLGLSVVLVYLMCFKALRNNYNCCHFTDEKQLWVWDVSKNSQVGLALSQCGFFSPHLELSNEPPFLCYNHSLF